MPKDVCTVELPEAGTTQVINLNVGEVNSFSFEMASMVGAPRLMDDGSLTMDLINGSSVVVPNFKEVADASSTSSGRETVIQLSDNTVINPENLYTQLASTDGVIADADLFAAVAPAAGDSGAGDLGVVSIDMPTQGSQELTVQAGQEYQFGFEMSDVQSMTQEGSDLVITFGNGEALTLNNYFTAANGAMPPVMIMADGSSVDAMALMPTFVASRAPAEGDVDASTAADIAPAAGEEAPATEETALEIVEASQVEITEEEIVVINEEAVSEDTLEEIAEEIEENPNQDLAALAEQLAEVEPAAGEAAAAGARGGFGFQSSTASVSLNSEPAIGAHQYTELAYDAPEFVDEPLPIVPPILPEFDVPSLVVKEDGSIDVVVDAPSTGTNDTLLVEIEVPAGWSVVDLNGGTYNSTTGIWSFTTATGADFLGGPEVAPPADSDLDASGLNITVTATNTVNGQVGTSTGTYGILTDAVADTPDLSASDAAGEEGQTIALDISTSTTDTDGSETISMVRISDVPAGMTLTAGTEVSAGVWELSVADLAGLGINVPDGVTGAFELTVQSTSDETPVSDDEFDFTDNQATATTTITLNVAVDDVPEPVTEVRALDESDLGPLTASGTVTVDYGLDGPGTISPNAANTFTVDGSVAGSSLTSAGSPVTVILSGNTYTGTSADGRDVFTMSVNTDGTYEFTLLDTLDHADGTNPNDIINLHFSYDAQDNEGDVVSGLISIQVADDAPVAVDDTNSLSDVQTVQTGNVLANDDAGNDTQTVVTQVTFDGATVDVPATGTATVVGDFGTLSIAADGSYTYTRTSDAAGDDVFTYSITDYDGDTSQANLTITTADANDVPEVDASTAQVDESGSLTATGTVNVDYQTDGPGTVTPTGTGTFVAGGSVAGTALTSNGSAVSVTLNGNTYTGTSADGRDVFTLTVASDGTYTFTLLDQLDHADETNPDDTITLQFGVTAEDADGDTTPSTITISVDDDGPQAVDDTDALSDNQTSTSGNVLSNDDIGFDEVGVVTDVTFNGVSVAVPATGTVNVTGEFGVLTISANGSYSYNRTSPNEAQDVFTYTVVDADGDPDTATLTINSDGADERPELGVGDVKIDETDLGPISVEGTLDAEFGSDGPGTISAGGADTFTYSGSVAGSELTSNGVPVTVTLNGNTYTGKAGNETIFTMDIEPNGDFTFELIGTLDHANVSDPDDIIDLTFGVTGTDDDGDTADSIITVHVHDDAPFIDTKYMPVDETNLSDTNPLTLTDTLDFNFGADGAGEVVTTDTFSAMFDVNGSSQPLTSGGSAVNVSETANGYVGVSATGETVFTLEINPTTGRYTYNQFKPLDHPDTTDHDDVIWLKFGIKVTDADGDSQTGMIGINVHDDGPRAYADTDALLANDMVATGNVLDNDDSGADVPPTVTNVNLNGTDYPVSETGVTTIEGEFGTLEISADGSYTYTRGSVDGGTDAFGYTMQDGDGDTSTTTLTFDVELAVSPKLIVGSNRDDVDPSTEEYVVGEGEGTIEGAQAGDILIGDDGGASLEEQNQDHNVVMVLDISGSMGDAADSSSRISLLVEAVKNLLTDLNEYDGGSVQVRMITFANGVQGTATFSISSDTDLADAFSFLDSLTANGLTNYESPLQDAISWLESSEPIENAFTTTYFISDGAPNRSTDDATGESFNPDTDSQLLGELMGEDGSDEISLIKALSDDVIGVGINIGDEGLSVLDLIDSDGNALNVIDPQDLDAELQELSPLRKLASLGDDVIEGGDGDDLIFGDSINTDQLALDMDIDVVPGSSWEVFTRLEAGESVISPNWSRSDTISYIKANAEELATESETDRGDKRQGGDDVLSGGAGDDVIFGQEGDDVISGGLGEDTLYGGSGADTFLFEQLDVDGNIDRVKDFNVGEGDVLDLSDFLQGFDPVTSAIEDFVFQREVGGNTVISVDISGSGMASNAQDLVLLEGTTIDDLQQVVVI